MTIQNQSAALPLVVDEDGYDELGRFVPEEPDVSHLVTEDGKPVDSIHSEQQMRLLVESLNTNWHPGFDFWAATNVGIYSKPEPEPLVLDVFLSLNVRVPENVSEKQNRCYFVWRFGKPPDLVVEIVPNKKGGELSNKLIDYARMGISHYVVFDPERKIQSDYLSVWNLRMSGKITSNETFRFEDIGLAVTLWEGVYEGVERKWMRWTNLEGVMIPTGAESTEQATRRADLAEKENQVLREKLRALGIEL